MISHWMKSTKNYTHKEGQKGNPFLYTADILPHQIPLSRRAKNYRNNLLSSLHGAYIFRALSNNFPPARIINGYPVLTEEKPDQNAKALVDNEKNLLLLLSPIHSGLTQQIDKLHKKEKQALHNYKPVHTVNKIKTQVNATLLTGKNDAVVKAIRSFKQDQNLNPKAFLYPIHVTETTTPALIAHLVNQTLQFYANAHLIPVVTSVNPQTQAALDLYLALQFNENESSGLGEFRRLTQVRLSKKYSTREKMNLKNLRDSIASAYLQDNHTRDKIFSGIDHTSPKHDTKLDRQIEQLTILKKQIRKSANATRQTLITYTDHVRSLTVSQSIKQVLITKKQAKADVLLSNMKKVYSQVQRKLRQLKHKQLQQLSNTKRNIPSQTKIINKHLLVQLELA